MKFGIIGTGVIAGVHKKAIESCGSVVSAVYSSDSSRAVEFGKKFNCKGYSNYEELLNSDVDIVDIVNENYLHADMGILAARMGKHVLVEKPIDISLTKAKKLVDECKKNNVKLGLVFQRRFDTVIKTVKNMLIKGEFGKPFLVKMSLKWNRPKEYYLGNWKNDISKCGGGVLINQAIHFVDLLYYVFGPVKSVYGVSKNIKELDVDDFVSVYLEFKNGVVGLLDASTSVDKSYPDCFSFYGDKKSLIVHGRKIVNYGFFSMVKSFLFNKYGDHKEVIQDFIGSIKYSRKPFIDGLDGLESLRIVKAIYSSIQLKRKVDL